MDSPGWKKKGWKVKCTEDASPKEGKTKVGVAGAKSSGILEKQEGGLLRRVLMPRLDSL